MQGPGDAGPSTGGGGVLAGNTDSPGVSTAKARWMRTTSKVNSLHMIDTQQRKSAV